MTVVPGYIAYPPELSYPNPSQTNEPAIVVKQQEASRRIYIPGDVDRSLWRSGHDDLSRLLRNCVHWLAGDDAPATIEGPGFIEAFAWETDPGVAVHVLNYTTPAAYKGWIREFHPIGSQVVRIKLPEGRRIVRAKLLRAETDLAFQVTGATVSFTIPRVLDYEVAALYAG